MKTPRIVLVILAIVVCSGPPACRGPAQRRYEDELRRSSESSLHAAHGRRLRELMRSLDRLARERLPVTMDVETPQETRAREISSVALALSESAGQIPEAAGDLPLDDAERVELAELAAELQRRARRLGESGDSLSPEALQAQVSGIQETCSGCHKRFRLTGVGNGNGR